MAESKTPPSPPIPEDQGLVARLASQRARFRDRADSLDKELKAAQKELKRITEENAELKTKADTSASAKRVAELEAKLRDVAHREVFDRIATSKGARSDALKDLYQLSGYKAEKEEIDEAAIGELVDAQKASRAYLFGEATPPSPNGTPPAPPKPGAASGQGGKPAGAPQLIADDDPRWSDVKYQFQNFDKISEAANQRLQRGEI